MKRHFINLLISSLAISVACSRITADKASAGSSLTIHINGGEFDNGAVSKADEIQSENEKKISRMEIFVYDDSGKLEWCDVYDSYMSDRFTIAGLREGRKDVAIVANKKLSETPQSLSQFKSMASGLTDNSRNSFVMTGMGSAMANSKSEVTDIGLVRLAAKFSFRGVIRTDWTLNRPESFTLTDVYVSNVGSRSSFEHMNTSTIENPRRGDISMNAQIRNLTYAERNREWIPGYVFNGGIDFYGYPNHTDQRTAVIIKALYNGRVCYYPIVIDMPIESNTLYNIGTVTISSEGVQNPWQDFGHVSIGCKVKAQDWEDGDREFISEF